MTTLTTTPEKSSSISYNPDQIVQALIRSRNEARKMKRCLLVDDPNNGPSLLVDTVNLMFDRVLDGIPIRHEDLLRMLRFFCGPPQKD